MNLLRRGKHLEGGEGLDRGNRLLGTSLVILDMHVSPLNELKRYTSGLWQRNHEEENKVTPPSRTLIEDYTRDARRLGMVNFVEGGGTGQIRFCNPFPATQGGKCNNPSSSQCGRESGATPSARYHYHQACKMVSNFKQVK